MFKIILFDYKSEKIVKDDEIELDLNDLERFHDYEEIEDFSKIPSSKIASKTVLEWFKVEHYSAWWLSYQIIYPKYQEAVLFIERLSNCLNHYTPKTLELRGCFSKIDIIEQICKQKNIKLKLSKQKKYLYDLKVIKNKIRKRTYKQLLEKKSKKRLEEFKPKNFSLPKKDFILFTVPGIYNREIYDIENKITKNQEFIIQPILNQLADDFLYYCIDIDYTLKGDIASSRSAPPRTIPSGIPRRPRCQSPERRVPVGANKTGRDTEGCPVGPERKSRHIARRMPARTHLRPSRCRQPSTAGCALQGPYFRSGRFPRGKASRPGIRRSRCQ